MKKLLALAVAVALAMIGAAVPTQAEIYYPNVIATGKYDVTYQCNDVIEPDGVNWVDVPVEIGDMWEIIACLFSDDGNRECTLEESLLGSDYDHDGTPDCEDVDDDNDRVSDRYESQATKGTNPYNRNTDGDVDPAGVLTEFTDLLDYDPQNSAKKDTDGNPIYEYGFTFGDLIYDWEDGTSSDCDGDGSAPEPYLNGMFISVGVDPDGTLSPWSNNAVALPTTWTRETTPDDRPDGTYTFEVAPKLLEGEDPDVKWLRVPASVAEISKSTWENGANALMMEFSLGPLRDKDPKLDPSGDGTIWVAEAATIDLLTEPSLDGFITLVFSPSDQTKCYATLKLKVKLDIGIDLEDLRNAISGYMNPDFFVA